MRFEVEMTDTFGGDANYSWVQRHFFDAADNVSDIALMRRAKKKCGLNGVRGVTSKFGDAMEFRPYGACVVMFVTHIEL